MHILSIEGNIGTGKSTIIKIIRDLIKNIKQDKINEIDGEIVTVLKKNMDKFIDNNSIEIITEPVDKWLNLIDDDDNENILDKFYKNQERWSYSFQMNAFITRVKDILAHSDKKVVIIERSVLTDRNVFAKLLYKDKKISSLEWKLYNEWFNWLSSSFDILPSKIIYLRASPEISYSRIKKRSRKEESSIPFKYIENVSIAHDNWLKNHNNCTILDVNDDFQENEDNKLKIVKTIVKEINSLLKD